MSKIGRPRSPAGNRRSIVSVESLIRYELAPVPFDRIRRITGYLVGTMDRWNDAKTAEESDRVKHGVSSEDRAFKCSNGC